MADSSPATLRPRLREAIRLCFSYQLTRSAKFLGQLLVALPHTQSLARPNEPKEDARRDHHRAYDSFVGCNEFARAAFWLKAKEPKDDLTNYRQLWSRWQAHLRSSPFPSPIEATIPSTTGNESEPLAEKLIGEIPRDTNNPFLLYLRAFFLTQLTEADVGGQTGLEMTRLYAIGTLCQSVSEFAYNWEAWELLKTLIKTEDELLTIRPHLPPTQVTVMTQFFNIAVCLHLRRAAEHDSMVNLIYDLTHLFPNFEWLREKMAVMFYQRKEFEKANAIFNNLFEANPHRKSELRTYAQSLFILKSKQELAKLVESRTLDPTDVEDLCLLGEYYASLQMERHAAQTFERVSKLEPEYIDAKELECQSLIELKETTKLLGKLRAIVGQDGMRYSAWNFLGSTHQILEMPSASLYYYQRAASIKAGEKNVWVALGEAYLAVHDYHSATQAFTRAFISTAYSDTSVLARLARLYDETTQYRLAAQCHEWIVRLHGLDEEIEEFGFDGPINFLKGLEKMDKRDVREVGKSLIYMARWEAKKEKIFWEHRAMLAAGKLSREKCANVGGRLELASRYCMRVMARDPEDADEAKEVSDVIEGLLKARKERKEQPLRELATSQPVDVEMDTTPLPPVSSTEGQAGEGVSVTME